MFQPSTMMAFSSHFVLLLLPLLVLFVGDSSACPTLGDPEKKSGEATTQYAAGDHALDVIGWKNLSEILDVSEHNPLDEIFEPKEGIKERLDVRPFVLKRLQSQEGNMDEFHVARVYRENHNSSWYSKPCVESNDEDHGHGHHIATGECWVQGEFCVAMVTPPVAISTQFWKVCFGRREESSLILVC